LLVEADYVSCGIAKPGSDLGRVRADGLHDLTPVDYDRVNGRGHTVHHNVKQEPGLCGGRAPEHPRAAHFAGRIVKSSAAIAAFPDVPAEDALVEVGRARNVRSGHLDVTDFPIRKRGRHRHSLQGVAILAVHKLKAIPHRPRKVNFLYAAFALTLLASTEGGPFFAPRS